MRAFFLMLTVTPFCQLPWSGAIWFNDSWPWVACCITGPAAPPYRVCWVVDMNNDGMVDLRDAAESQALGPTAGEGTVVVPPSP